MESEGGGERTGPYDPAVDLKAAADPEPARTHRAITLDQADRNLWASRDRSHRGQRELWLTSKAALHGRLEPVDSFNTLAELILFIIGHRLDDLADIPAFGQGGDNGVQVTQDLGDIRPNALPSKIVDCPRFRRRRGRHVIGNDDAFPRCFNLQADLAHGRFFDLSR